MSRLSGAHLHEASGRGYGQADLVRLLLEHGSDPYAAKGHGMTALDMALIGAADMDRFTLGACQTSTVRVLLDFAPDLTYHGDLAEVLFLRLKDVRRWIEFSGNETWGSSAAEAKNCPLTADRCPYPTVTLASSFSSNSTPRPGRSGAAAEPDW